jgi:BolA protein
MSRPDDPQQQGEPPAAAGRPTAAEVRERLLAAFPDADVAVVDDSHRHAGHAGAAGGAGHYTVSIAAASFRGLATVARHRLVYDALSDWIPGRVHALSIRAALPAD